MSRNTDEAVILPDQDDHVDPKDSISPSTQVPLLATVLFIILVSEIHEIDESGDISD